MKDLKIDNEFKDLIPPLTPDEFEQLEKNILEEGCRDSLILWGDTLLDGHNRYNICTKHNLPFATKQAMVETREEAIEWIILNQFGRRNLPLYERAKLALRLKPVIAEKAKEQQRGGQGGVLLSQKSVEAKVDTQKELAKTAGVSHDTIAKVEKIEEKATPEIKQQLSKGEISINKAYTNIRNQEKKEQFKAKTLEVAEKYEEDANVKIVNDDCTNYLKTLEDNSIDLIVVDPPYFGIVKEEWDNQWDNKLDFMEWCKEWMIESLRVLKDTGSFYIWGQVGELSDILIHQKLLLDDLGFHFKDWITWKKRRGLGNRKGWLYTREECLWYVKDNKKFQWNESEQYSQEKSSFTKGFSGYELKSENKRITNVWNDIPEFIGDKGLLHYTPKPVEAIERIIKSHTLKRDTVLDFFAGSGTTGVAAKKNNRNCILVEKDNNSINEIKRRLSDEI